MAKYRNELPQLLAVLPEETFDGTWPFEARYNEAPGFRMHYVDEGKGETVLALHGEPTWGYLFRNLIKTLSPRHRVITPDHMGFGKSETPPRTGTISFRTTSTTWSGSSWILT